VDPAHKYEIMKSYKGRKSKMTRILGIALASTRWKSVHGQPHEPINLSPGEWA
jgi:hypothetical protein